MVETPVGIALSIYASQLSVPVPARWRNKMVEVLTPDGRPIIRIDTLVPRIMADAHHYEIFTVGQEYELPKWTAQVLQFATSKQAKLLVKR